MEITIIYRKMESPNLILHRNKQLVEEADLIES